MWFTNSFSEYRYTYIVSVNKLATQWYYFLQYLKKQSRKLRENYLRNFYRLEHTITKTLVELYNALKPHRWCIWPYLKPINTGTSRYPSIKTTKTYSMSRWIFDEVTYVSVNCSAFASIILLKRGFFVTPRTCTYICINIYLYLCTCLYIYMNIYSIHFFRYFCETCQNRQFLDLL